jgi:phosphoglycerol transferase MdoB-like AlkP superfamily enzyme
MTWALVRYAGLIFAPGVWAVNTQLGQILPYGDCAAGSQWTAWATFSAAVISAGTAFLSWQQKDHVVSRPRRAMTYVAVFSAFSFAFALVLQGAATVLLSPCLH